MSATTFAQAAEAESGIDQRLFRDVMGHLPTGVAAVTGMEAETGKPAGMIVGTFQSLSLTPALVTFSVDRSSTSWPRIRTSGRFSISVLAEHQTDVCTALSRKGDDKFAGVDWVPSPENAAPHFRGAAAWFDCETVQELDGGDHVIVIGRVLYMEAGSAEPLVFHRGKLGGYRAPAAA